MVLTDEESLIKIILILSKPANTIVGVVKKNKKNTKPVY